MAIVGNSGSGKSSLARYLTGSSGARSLDLDTVAWEPGQIAVPRSPAAAGSDVIGFCTSSRDWMIEGCYDSLLTIAIPYLSHLIFLNPGEEQCISNCLARPWEAHKDASREEQNDRLELLLEWVKAYYVREGKMSLASHRRLFESFKGHKIEITAQPCLAGDSSDLLRWLALNSGSGP